MKRAIKSPSPSIPESRVAEVRGIHSNPERDRREEKH
jgi:hypothetical protein